MGIPFDRTATFVRQTWQAFRPVATPLRVLRERWPAVLPHYEGAAPATAGTQSIEAWQRALAAFDELSQHTDQDTLLRRAVELLRSAMGLERAAIFLLDPSRERLYGTWGTGADGETTDEHHIAFDIGTSHREAFAHAQGGSAQWTRFSDVPLFAETARGTIVLRNGENVIIPIPGRSHSLGLIACDWAFTGTRADTETLLRAAVFTRVLSPHWERLEQQRLNAMGNVEAASSPAAAHEEQLAVRVVAELRRDPNLERNELSRRLGVTPDRLGRAVKAALGESLCDYRNRLRVQRFLAIVDPAGGNLLEAALDAGFGSYAQFHRVFRQIFGCSPIEHLRNVGRTMSPKVRAL
jgi:AraC-like DNA-binding protein